MTTSDDNDDDFILIQKRIMLNNLVSTAKRSIAELQILLDKTARIWGKEIFKNLEFSKTNILIRRAELFIEYYNSSFDFQKGSSFELADRIALFAMQVLSQLDRRIVQFQMILQKYQEQVLARQRQRQRQQLHQHANTHTAAVVRPAEEEVTMTMKARKNKKTKKEQIGGSSSINSQSYQVLLSQQQYSLYLGFSSAAIEESASLSYD
eukprot:CAMPEP_0116031598 /NCGR_PEP_ID=MMETSP0321-20121206/17652_1 /TAXON_ID=163516 /ORGANISM="Leptocylindrus danicus var. danicus, Strain B650" /LENGTH=207 /DNA_ID=CAMNT_0003506839 /DNA_START=205 /DNA_END=828 /DNA_ORIENTATION=-